MLDAIKLITKTKNSKSYIKYQEYHINNILGFTKISRWELMHSNFIAWLLDDCSSLVGNHEQMFKFIYMLLNVCKEPVNEKARVDINVLYKFFLDSTFIENLTVKRETDKIDILIEVQTKEKILPIIIENKVESKENGKHRDQTQVYFDLCEDKYKDQNLFFKPIYVFLKPIYNKTKPTCDKYLMITYQDLVDYVIEPVMVASRNDASKENIRIYLQCLSFQKDNEKGDQIMAISSEEKELLRSFIRENKDIFINAIEFSDECDEKQKKAVRSIVDNIIDTTKYSFNGHNDLGKGRLVLEVIKYYCKEHPMCTFDELKKAFPNELAKSTKKGVFDLETNISDKDKGIGSGHKRYFVDEPIILTSGEKIFVSNQWGINSIKPFIEHCNKKLGIAINEIK